jgi:hypothetical protein
MSTSPVLPAVAKNPFPLLASKYSFQFILPLLEKQIETPDSATIIVKIPSKVKNQGARMR